MVEHIKQNGNENVSGNGHKPARHGRTPKWTVMVYLAGDNNLTANCITVLQQLEAVKYKRNVRVLACFDSNTPWPKGSRYLAINCKWNMNNRDVDWEIYNDLIMTEERGHAIKAPDFCPPDEKVEGTHMKRTDVAQGLKRFLRWAMKHHHKQNPCMLILYGHGPVVAGRTFLSRENPLSSLRMTDLPKILKPHFGGERPKLDILALQNCAMNGIETAWEVKDQVDYMIGSQGLVLAYGWPYERIVSALVDNPTDTPLQITEKILKACARHLIDFSVMDRSSEQSVCDLSKLDGEDNIKDAIRELSRTLQDALEFKTVREQTELDERKRNLDEHERKSADKQLVLRYPVICDAVRLARLEAQSYWGETFVDVYDFCERLLKKCNEAIKMHEHFVSELVSTLGIDRSVDRPFRKTDLVTRLTAITECCMKVMDRVEEMVPHSYYIGPELQYSCGLSIYFPWSMPGEPYTFYRRGRKEHVLVTAFETYSRYAFAEESEWAAFLKSFYKATLRKVRRAHRKFGRRNVKDNLSYGIVRETYTEPTVVLPTEYLQKTDSNSGGVDLEVWSNIKNYPRRNYLSPSDCPRRPEVNPDFRNPLSPGVSYLGWNLCKFVADVIMKKEDNYASGKTKAKSQKKTDSAREQTTQERAQPLTT